jgi:multicomponent Na+:H+ antiporter subunit E
MGSCTAKSPPGFFFAGISVISFETGYSVVKRISSRTRNYIVLLVLMMGFWLLLSGHYDSFHITLGVISVLLVAWLDSKLLSRRFFPAGEKPPRLRIIRLHFLYFPWLLWQIIIAALQVAYAIMMPHRTMNVSLLRFRTKLPSITAKVILGNSITLTPGTLTLDIDGDEFLVHSLTDSSAEGILNGDFPDHVGSLFHGSQSKGMTTEMEVITSAGGL